MIEVFCAVNVRLIITMTYEWKIRGRGIPAGNAAPLAISEGKTLVIRRRDFLLNRMAFCATHDHARHERF